MWGCVSASRHLAGACRKWDRDGETRVYTSNQSYFITNRRQRCCGGGGYMPTHPARPNPNRKYRMRHLVWYHLQVSFLFAVLNWPVAWLYQHATPLLRLPSIQYEQPVEWQPLIQVATLYRRLSARPEGVRHVCTHHGPPPSRPIAPVPPYPLLSSSPSFTHIS